MVSQVLPAATEALTQVPVATAERLENSLRDPSLMKTRAHYPQGSGVPLCARYPVNA